MQVYSEAEVASLLLRLQDEHGADVNLMLACGWLAASGRALSPQLCAEAVAQTASWRQDCVVPLRGVRRYLKSVPDQAEFRARIQALELEAEQYQQQQLYRVLLQADAADSAGFEPLALENLRQYLIDVPGVQWRAVSDDARALVAAWGRTGR